MKTIDKLTWKFSRIEPEELGRKLELGEDIEIHIKATVIQHIIGDNNDGTANLCMVVKPFLIELKDDDN